MRKKNILSGLTKGLKIFSEKTVEFTKITGYKTEIEVIKNKIGAEYKKIGKKLYTELKVNTSVDKIIEDIQPQITEIESYFKEIDEINEKIKTVKVHEEIVEDSFDNPIDEEIENNSSKSEDE